MPWTTPELVDLVDQAKREISKFYSKKSLTATVLISTEEELVNALIQEKISEKTSEQDIRKIKILRSFIEGRYFKNKNEIWLVQQRGEKIGTLIHECLHSIQECSPNRERIVEYLTYKLTGDTNELLTARLKEWVEIKRSIGLKKIIDQLLLQKDCEEF